MLIVIVGESGSGKSTIAKTLAERHNVPEIVTYTTRNKRIGEKNGIDYHFVTNDIFQTMIDNNQFIEYEEYSQGRFYGTTKESIIEAANNGVSCIVVTPGGMRNIEKIVDNNKLLKVYLNVPLGERVQRYIKRCGVNKFNFDDMNEINARVNRDFGMFLGIEKEVDTVIDNYSNNPNLVSDIIYDFMEEKIYDVER